jgi:hypothetical protein
MATILSLSLPLSRLPSTSNLSANSTKRRRTSECSSEPVQLGRKRRRVASPSQEEEEEEDGEEKQRLGLPLTFENLQRHQTLADMATMAPPRAQSSSSRSGSQSPSKGDTDAKLRCFGIFTMRGTPLPPSLELFVDGTIKAKRATTTPSAARIARSALAAAKMSEQDGIDLLKRDLLCHPASASDDGGERYVSINAKPNLRKDFVPIPVDAVAAALYSRLEQPQPDHSLGYVLADIAAALGRDAPFTYAEERVFSSLSVCAVQSFPFLTAQWKSIRNNGNHHAAREQAARDGATIVASTFQFFKKARPDRDPPPEDTCHFSLTCDLETVLLYCHWRCIDGDQVTYEMERIQQAFLSECDSLIPVRHTLRNIIEYAQDTRLARIRAAIPLLEQQLRPLSLSNTSASFMLNPAVGLPSPLTAASSLASGPAHSRDAQPPPKKRQRHTANFMSTMDHAD